MTILLKLHNYAFVWHGIRDATWHELAEDRTAWKKAVKKGVRSFEDDRVKAREDKRLKRKANEALDTIVQQIASANFVCQTCGRACKSRIGLYSHSRTHPQQHWHHRNRWVHHHYTVFVAERITTKADKRQ